MNDDIEVLEIVIGDEKFNELYDSVENVIQTAFFGSISLNIEERVTMQCMTVNCSRAWR